MNTFCDTLKRTAAYKSIWNAPLHRVKDESPYHDYVMQIRGKTGLLRKMEDDRNLKKKKNGEGFKMSKPFMSKRGIHRD